ncbi:hypothetical protein K9U39_17810 [Rhodoblastus acidophilus]|uniref:Uncharacterized protein n=1 Tax=Candidatus Rhodoblastus alkanivorans TaxID=2954117 RepID=A0ABS9Z2Q1_9HYPH|nr:hypothetical protein [Candidatus Rhodoblastus alkanivorans]MCI4679025.1 hypothetical protein [Candidatus Rhodoblastus alkanivorans]MCI4681720.1 hypothetical protein [Candidatus Rhodoblastus alkanivorans]MDI4642768.1 hypothetical protein [Rhodoblastus acidophilus]
MYIGSDLPAKDLAAVLLKNEADLAVISYVLPTPASAQMQRDLARALSGRVEIWLGGPAGRIQDLGTLPAGVAALHSFAPFAERLSLRSR